MNIVIFMAIWCQNLWDELILKNEIELLKKKYAWNKLKFQVFSYDISEKFVCADDIEYYEYFPIGIKNPKNLWRNIKNYFTFIKIIKNASKIVFGWGGILFDSETGNYSNPLTQILFRVKTGSIFKKDILFYGVSLDIKNPGNFPVIKEIFTPAKEVYVRDTASSEFLLSLWISSQIILDPVFSDNGEVGVENYKKNSLLKKINAKDFSVDDIQEYDFEGKTVWLAFRKWYLTDEQQLIWKVVKYLIKTWAKVVLLPHSFHKVDLHANDYEFLQEFVWDTNVSITKNMQETYVNYKEKRIDFCISMRLHSMILSQVYGIPFISIKYAKKADLM